MSVIRRVSVNVTQLWKAQKCRSDKIITTSHHKLPKNKNK